MKSRMLLTATGLLAVMFMAAQANAFSLPANTKVEMKYSNWEMLVDKDNSGDFSVGDELWGLLRVTSINDTANRPLWNPLASNEEITGKFSGLVVSSVNTLADNRFSIQFTGGELDLFLHAPTDALPDTANFSSFVSGERVLSTRFNYGILNGNTSVTMNMDVNALTSPLSGTNSFYLDVIGGTLAKMFDSDAFTIFDGSKRDILGKSHIASGLGIDDFGFDYTSGGDMSAVPAPVPEPSTFFLLGAGLLGIGVYSRKKAKK